MKRKQGIISLVLAVIIAFASVTFLHTDTYAAGKMKFTDVSSKSWYYEYVQYVFEKGMMTGLSDTKFGPNANLTRAMVITVLYRLSEEEVSKVKKNVFNDVPAGKWYSEAISWAMQAGIAVADSNGKFYPDTNITRQDMCMMLKGYADYICVSPVVTVSGNYTDKSDANQVDEYAKTAVAWAYKRGYIGKDSGLNPKGKLTRAEAAAMFTRFDKSFTRLKAGDTITLGTYAYTKKGTAKPIKWDVLEVKGGEAFIVSKYVLDCKPYNTTKVAVKWETSSLRTLLNGAFYKKAFTDAEKKRIVKKTIVNNDNAEYGVSGGSKTKDYLFLLSIDDVNKYYKNFVYYDEDEVCDCIGSKTRAAKSTAYAKAKGVFTSEWDWYSGNGWYWLRSPGKTTKMAAFVHCDGSVDIEGYEVNDKEIGVRPACWIKVKGL